MRFYVRGRGEFPYDMLRYDTAYPSGPDDAAMLCGGRDAEERTVCLVSANGRYTPGRWYSFGWSANYSDVWS